MRVRKKELGKANISGANIEQIRKHKGMRQKDLLIELQVRGIEISSSGISKIEGQIRTLNDYELAAIADALGVSMQKLCGLEE